MLYDFILLLRNPHLRPRVLNTLAAWIFFTTLGWIAAGFTGLPIGRVVLVEGGAGEIFSVAGGMAVIGALIGALAATGQWFYLRRRHPGSLRWLLATSLGWAVGLPLALVLNQLFGLGISAGLYGLFVGAGVGLAQGLLCRRVTRKLPQWWIANLLAFVLGISTAGSFERTLLFSSGGAWGAAAWQSAVTAGISGVIVGLVTGIALVVLRHTPEAGHDE